MKRRGRENGRCFRFVSRKERLLRLEAEGFTVKRYRDRTLPQGHAHGE